MSIRILEVIRLSSDFKESYLPCTHPQPGTLAKAIEFLGSENLSVISEGKQKSCNIYKLIDLNMRGWGLGESLN